MERRQLTVVPFQRRTQESLEKQGFPWVLELPGGHGSHVPCRRSLLVLGGSLVVAYDHTGAVCMLLAL